jgi:hypothetical protein
MTPVTFATFIDQSQDIRKDRVPARASQSDMANNLGYVECIASCVLEAAIAAALTPPRECAREFAKPRRD